MNKTQPKKREPVRLYSLILLAAAAAVWTANCIVLAVFQRQAAGLKVLLALDVICAVIWWVAFTVNLLRYRRARQESQEDWQPVE